MLSVPVISYGFAGWRGRRGISRVINLWARGVAKIINLRIKICGDIPAVPAGLVVSNHAGYVDIITHGAVFPPRFAPSAEIAGWPVLGRIVALTDPVWVDRGLRASAKKVSRDFAKTMKRGMYLIVYPEGTSTDGRGDILPFKSTSFEAAIAGDVPVLPVVTRYHEDPDRPTVCWYGDMTFFPHFLRVLKLPYIEAELRFLPPVFPEGRNRKELASAVHGMMMQEWSSPRR